MALTLDDIDAKLDALDSKIDSLDAKLDAVEEWVRHEREMKSVCYNCGGTGLVGQYVQPVPPTGPSIENVECPLCSGSGMKTSGEVGEL